MLFKLIFIPFKLYQSIYVNLRLEFVCCRASGRLGNSACWNRKENSLL